MFRNPTTDLIVVLVIVLLIFGPKRLPSLGKQLGHGIREFKDGITGSSKPDQEEERRELAQMSAPPVAQPVQEPVAQAAPTQPSAPQRESADLGSERSS